MVSIEREWSICFKFAFIVLNIITTLEILSPPAVEPAQAPVIISNKIAVLDSVGHKLKSVVENPVVVTIEET